MTLPLVLTPGHGIGPEITARWLATRPDYPVWVVGDAQVLAGLKPPSHVQLVPLEASPGRMAYQALEWAVQAIAQGQASGLVTGPISKSALWQDGYTQYSGHTEILADLANRFWPGQAPYQSDMLFVHQQLRLLLLTRHVPLTQVSQHLTLDGVSQSLTTVIEFLNQVCTINYPRLAMLGVNPHAGEIGGQEEHHILIPASQQVMTRLPCHISTPLPADGFFRGFNPAETPFDAIVSPYHDQGLVAFKLLAGWQAVNVTIGLPFLRTSVSHGTASDIVGQNKAKADSLLAAITCLQQWL
jgi:4-hydroxythreonine-4-phosphate dehydrogenase